MGQAAGLNANGELERSALEEVERARLGSGIGDLEECEEEEEDEEDLEERRRNLNESAGEGSSRTFTLSSTRWFLYVWIHRNQGYCLNQTSYIVLHDKTSL